MFFTSMIFGLIVTMAILAAATDSNDPSVNGTWKYFLADDYVRSDPPRRDGDPVKVYVKLSILNVEDIDEDQMRFVMNCVIFDIWDDFRLLVDNSPYEFPYKFSVDGYNMIWKPDLTFENTKWGDLFPISVPNIVIQLEKDGYLYRQARYSLNVGCFMQFHQYPMDTQHCEFIINLFGSHDKFALLHWVDEPDSPHKESFSPAVESADSIHPLQFQFVKPVYYKRTVKKILGNYTQLVVNFTFIRHLTGSIVNTYIPSALVVVLSWVSFWLDVNSVPGRVSLGVTSILTLSTTLIQSRVDSRVSYLRALDIWLLFCLVMVFALLIEYAVAYHLWRTGSKSLQQVKKRSRSAATLTRNQRSVTPEPQNMSRSNSLVPVKDAKDDLNLINLSNSALLETSKEVEKDLKTTVLEKKKLLVTPLDGYCRVAFPALFLSFAIIYWGYYLSRRSA